MELRVNIPAINPYPVTIFVLKMLSVFMSAAYNIQVRFKQDFFMH